MGCNNSKPVHFDGTPDEEVQHHAKSIKLAAQSGEAGKGPENRIISALRGVLKATEPSDSIIYPSSADKLAAAIESLRTEVPNIYNKYINEVNVARIATCNRIVYTDLSDAELALHEAKKDFSRIKWIPKVVNVSANSKNILGSSVEFGLSGPGAASVGFCVEAWVLVDQPHKKGEGLAVSLVDVLSTSGRNPGMCPTFGIDQEGKCVMDFHKRACLPMKNKLVEVGVWTHVAFVFGRDIMTMYLNGAYIGSKDSPPPSGEVALSVCSGLFGFVTELRVWNCERSDEEIVETMNKSIPPSSAKNYPGLRLCWMPLAKGSTAYTPGAFLYDAWRKRPVGMREGMGSVPDTRWPCALPSALIPDTAFLYCTDHLEEAAESWEHFAMESVAAQEPSKKYVPSSSVVENRALQIVSVLMRSGGPWIPRVVSLPPGTSACVGLTDQLDLVSEKGFTVECWVRIRGLGSGDDNTIIGVGRGDPCGESNGMRLVLRHGRPCFVLMGVTVETELGVPKRQWTHIAFVHTGQSQQVFVNGTLMAKAASPSLSGSCTLNIGSDRGEHSLNGDLCELRVWNRPMDSPEIIEYMKIAIPPLGGKGHKDLRLTWLPLRNGGPFSQEVWCRRKLMSNKMKKPPTPAGLKQISSPTPSLLWDVWNMRDVGFLLNPPVDLLASRTRNLHLSHLIPPVEELPRMWSKSAVAVIDEWTDSFDRAFVPKWYEAPQVDESDHEAFSQFPTNAAEAVAKGTPWIARVMRTRSGCDYSLLVGATAEIGLLGVGTGGREFTLELWIRPRSTEYDKKGIVFEDILGHEDKESNKATGMFGIGQPNALRIGLANGQPFMNFQGQIKSLRNSDLKEGVITSASLPPNVWSHVAFVAVGDGKLLIYVNAKEVARKDRISPLQAKADAPLYAFGYEDRLLRSDICELRLWTTSRAQSDIEDYMNKSIAPMPTGLARVPDLRLAWFPTNSMRSVFWDHKFVSHRGVYPTGNNDKLPKYTRRPHFLPPRLRATTTTLPCAAVLDDKGDAFERHLSHAMLPPVVRFPDGTVDYAAYDPDFEPLKKKADEHFMSVSTQREEIDIGWDDSCDGAIVAGENSRIDDGGWMEEWEKGDMESICEEVVDASLFIPPVDVATLPSSRPITPASALTDPNVPTPVQALTTDESGKLDCENTQSSEANPVPGQTPTGEVPVEEVPNTDLRADDLPGEEVPIDEIPAAGVPGNEAPAADVPGNEAPTADVPGDEVLCKEAEVENLTPTTAPTCGDAQNASGDYDTDQKDNDTPLEVQSPDKMEHNNPTSVDSANESEKKQEELTPEKE
mmetsp:Transcript_14277/g.21370  ORF Transcript_14277/g.21370 Transcript_14277/m.21370 type:complete len:1308 (+) Transcript_14277:215-4138(+)|eukprot:CAMPEP_0185033360 /NCGR_PEP_ID=MMETSP1103-20130426/22203_1 /TAXON_ID=36769 /ORGANISM="Paraphysomonas bandaiensis, Strain Caron Lab Isolate" /LENGTH=1307 /DNA_ID=CAMNT_0027569589 /DNA_START=144 /DNA_END=4067 /DNA_ORIENTATION=-